MSVVATISGIAKNFQVHSFSIELGLGGNAKHARGTLIINVDQFPTSKPLAGQVLEILADGTREFKGPLTRVTDTWINPRVYTVEVEAVDFIPLLDSHLVTTELAAGSLSTQINYILNRFCTDFSLGALDYNPTLAAQSLNYRPASEIFNGLAEITGQVFDLDFDKQIHFYQTGSVAPIASFVVEDENRIGDLVATEDWSNLYNVLILTGVTIRTPYAHEEKFMADGYRSIYGLAWTPWSIYDIAVAVSTDGGGTWGTKSVRLDPLDSLSPYECVGGESEATQIANRVALEQQRQAYLNGSPGEVYISIKNRHVRFPLSELPEEGWLIRTRYHVRRSDQILESRNLTSIAAVAVREGTDGVHEMSISLPAIRATSLSSAMAYAEMLLARGAWPVIKGSFKTFLKGWAPAQQCTISSAIRDIEDPHGDPVAAWIHRVVKKFPAVDEDGNTQIHHTVEFVDNPYTLLSLDIIIHRLIVDQIPPGPVPFTTSTSTTTTSTSTSSTSTSTTSTSTTLLPDNWCVNDELSQFPEPPRGNIPIDETQFIRIIACATGYVTDGRVYVRAANAGTLRLGVYDDTGDGNTPGVLRGQGTVTPSSAGYARVSFSWIDFLVAAHDIVWLAFQNSIAGDGGHQLARRGAPGTVVYNKETDLWGYADGLPAVAPVTTLDLDETYYGAVWVDMVPYTSTSTSSTSTSTTSTSTSWTGTSTSTTSTSTSTTSTSTSISTSTVTLTSTSTSSSTSTTQTYLPGAILLEATTPV